MRENIFIWWDLLRTIIAKALLRKNIKAVQYVFIILTWTYSIGLRKSRNNVGVSTMALSFYIWCNILSLKVHVHYPYTEFVYLETGIYPDWMKCIKHFSLIGCTVQGFTQNSRSMQSFTLIGCNMRSSTLIGCNFQSSPLIGRQILSINLIGQNMQIFLWLDVKSYLDKTHHAKFLHMSVTCTTLFSLDGNYEDLL